MTDEDRWAWWHIDLPGYRPYSGPHVTYEEFDYESLPPPPARVNKANPGAWLYPSAAEADSIGDQQMLPRLVEVAGARLVDLPEGLVQLAAEPALQRCIGTVTGCWLNFGDNLEQVGGEGTVLVRFLSDQQDCLHWFVRLKQDRTNDVVVSGYPYCETRFPLDGVEDFIPPRDLFVCAATFNEFLWRFWIENAISYSLSVAHSELTPEQLEYVSAYSKHS